MTDPLESFPHRVNPYLTMDELNQPIPLIPGPFRLVGSGSGSLDASLTFRWLPSTAIAFEGIYSGSSLGPLAQPWLLEAQGELSFRATAIITQVSSARGLTHVRGITQGFSMGEQQFEVLRFSLANFPDYFGGPIRHENEGYNTVMLGRIEGSASHGQFRLDVIPEAGGLRESASRDAGFVISHVGEWLPLSKRMTTTEAEEIISMLHFWFGLLRGAWAGPLFPQGLAGGDVVWRQFGPWPLDESREVNSWIPQRKSLDLADLFSGFARRWNETAWRGPLISSISWLVEANSSRAAVESKIILAHVALDLLAWVHLVETQNLHSRTQFKRFPASDRIRALMLHIGVPTTIPDHLTHLLAWHKEDQLEGPEMITWIRNALVHASEGDRETIASLNGPYLFQCSQLALQYVELALLSVCGYAGHYARRGWQGWKGDDEILVPWASKE